MTSSTSGEWSFAEAYLKVPLAVFHLLKDDALAFTLYVLLLSKAAWTKGTRMTKHGPVELDVGELVCGRRELAQALELRSDTPVRRRMNRLETNQLIVVKETQRGTFVTICRYAETYARAASAEPSNEPTIGAKATQKRRANEPLSRSQIGLEGLDGQDRRARSRRRAPQTPLPEGWTPKPLHAELARALGVDLQREEDRFRDHADTHERHAANWDAAFRTWLKKAADFATTRRGPRAPAQPEHLATDEEHAAEAARMNGARR